MDKFKFVVKNKLNELPKTTGVYCFISSTTPGVKNLTPVYIGKAINIKNRVKNHFQQPSYRDDIFIDKITKIGFFETNSEIEALILEANLIKKYQPRFNVVWRDDKNYFYVAIAENKDSIPYIFITHQKNHQKTRYIGPFVEGTALKKTLRFLRKAFPYYTTKHHPKNNCAYCHLELCPGPYDKEALRQSLRVKNGDPFFEYKKNIKKLILILKGKRNAVLISLKKEMKNFSKKRDFEKAGETRDKIFALQQIMSHTKVIEPTEIKYVSDSEQKSHDREISAHYYKNSAHDLNWFLTQEILKKITETNKNIKRIECYDVSNIQGKQATGSMVVFINGKPAKNLYRKFHIKIEGKPNDTAMIKEVLQRRLKHSEWTCPEIMLIDGGIAQLNVALKTKNQKPSAKNIKILSIAKKNNELYIEGKDKPILLKTLPREIFNLVLQLRDEAHRFAIAYHKKLRKNYLLK